MDLYRAHFRKWYPYLNNRSVSSIQFYVWVRQSVVEKAMDQFQLGAYKSDLRGIMIHTGRGYALYVDVDHLFQVCSKVDLDVYKFHKAVGEHYEW